MSHSRLHAILHPRSLAGQTSALLIIGLALVELAGLVIHALDHIDYATRSQIYHYQLEVLSIYRTVAGTAPEDRAAALQDLHIPAGTTALLLPTPDPEIPSRVFPLPQWQPGTPFHPAHAPLPGVDAQHTSLPQTPPPNEGGREIFPQILPSAQIEWGLLPSPLYPRDMRVGHKLRTRSVSLLLPDHRTWLVVRYATPLPTLFGSPSFLVAFLLMSTVGSALIVWGSNRLIAPISTLANAAEALGRDVHTAALPERGPSEIRRAAIAFNTMAHRLRRFITDRTLMLTAIGHDLRTPITRLKLRAEFIDDDELRGKILSDLDEMEAMVDTTLAFGRDSASAEPLVTLDLGALLQTILDEAAESQPHFAQKITFERSETPVKIRARSVALKRALNNLVLNALKYGGSAHVTMEAPQTLPTTAGRENLVRVMIEDDGPGLPADQLERVFEPFVRIETSRNRETGGTGLGLSIARTILRGQGGDVRLANRPEGGLRAVVTLAA